MKLRRRTGPPPVLTGNCSIREHAGDGAYVGRCHFATYDHICPRHGVLEDYPNNDDRDLPIQDRRGSRASDEGSATLAARYGVAYSTIVGIRNGNGWAGR